MVSTDEELPGEAAAIERAFGVANRRRILAEYFASAGTVHFDNAWQHVYRLLLWINPTISLAHCYESDKCQPHKAWYARSLAFHEWVSGRMGVAPVELREQIDKLFRAALPALAQIETEARRAAGARHLAQYQPGSMPLPGDDPDLFDLVTDALGIDPDSIDPDLAGHMVDRIYTHFARENKRKNLLGRGFEDTLAAVIERLPGREGWDVQTRVPLAAIPGFLPQSDQLKKTEVDLALWQRARAGHRILVSAKWSVRADRERQFDSDFDDYSKSSAGGLFDYVLITNEFDAARLDAACTKVRGNQYLFTRVVHVEPEGVLVAYGEEAVASAGSATGRKARQLPRHIESGRLCSLSTWLRETIG